MRKTGSAFTTIFFGFITIVSLLLYSCTTNPDIPFTPHEFTDAVAFRNPVIKGFNPDPSICRVGDDYYVVTSSFEYFPGVPIYHSKDLVNWKQIGNVLNRESQIPLGGLNPSAGIWAPTIRYHDGTFYMITTLMPEGKSFYVTAQDPAGPWSDPIVIPVQNIDPSLYFDDDGTVYYTGTSPWDGSEHGIYQAEIDIATGEFLTEYQRIWDGTGGRYPEGPHLYKFDDWYYLMISEGGTETGHAVVIARSKKPFGPFESSPHNPILTNRDEPFSNPVQNSGHADLVQSPDGKWWMVHLAVRNVNKHHHLGRETFVLPVEWNGEGWPVVNREGVSHLEVFAIPPAPQRSPEASRSWDFTEPPGPEWTWLRNPTMENYSFDTSRGILEITGSVNTLDDLASPSFIGIRQTDFEQEFIAELTTSLIVPGDEAGLTVLMNNEHYYTISKIKTGQGEVIQLGMKLGRIYHIEKSVTAPPGKIWLKIASDREMYRFFWSDDGQYWEPLGENFAKLLSTETAGGFTGVFNGVFVVANDTGNPAKAKFQSIRIN